MAATPTAKRLVVTGFKPGSWVLTKNMKKSIDAFFKASGQPRKVSCTGYTMGLTVLKVDQNLANRRAQATCSYVMSKNAAIATPSTMGLTTKNASSTYRRTLITLGF